MLLRAVDAREPVSPTNSIPVPEYDGWASFDSVQPVWSPKLPVAVSIGVKDLEEQHADDREDLFGFFCTRKEA